MRRVLLPLALVLPAAAVLAQKPVEARGPSSAQREFEQLVDAHRTAMGEYNYEVRALEKTPEYQAAVKERDRAKVNELRSKIERPDMAVFTEQFQKAAAKYEGTAGEIDFLVWIATNSADKDAAEPAVQALLERHMKDEKLLGLMENGTILLRSLGQDGCKEVLDKVVAESPHAVVRAWALYDKAQIVLRNRTATEEAKAEANEWLAEAAKLAEGTDLAMRLNGPTFAEERLQIGMEAPDIVGEDLEGVPFKLSDYRGKVVVIDFWGDW